MITRHGIIHFLFHPVSAKRFAEPLAAAAIADGIEAELWVESIRGLEAFRASLAVPSKNCPSNLGFNPFKAAATFFILLGRLAKRKPLAVEAHLFRGAFLPLLAAWITRVPVRIYHNHGVSYLGYRGFLRRLLMTIEGANCWLATHVITVSDELRTPLQAVMLARRSIMVFGPGTACGLPADAFAPSLDPTGKLHARAVFGFGPQDLAMLYVGRPHRHKGFFLLLAVFAKLFATRGDVHLLLCGCNAADVAAALPEVPPNIRALGYHQNLRPMYQAADIVVLPSLYEGLPYSLLEGAAQGCALLASRIPGAGALVEEGKNGFLVMPDDKSDLDQVLQRIDRERNNLGIMGAAAYEKAQQFKREKVIGPYLAFLRDALGKAAK